MTFSSSFFLTITQSFYNDNKSADKTGKLRSQVDEVKNVMIQNVDKVLARGEKWVYIYTVVDELNYVQNRDFGGQNRRATEQRSDFQNKISRSQEKILVEKHQDEDPLMLRHFREWLRHNTS